MIEYVNIPFGSWTPDQDPLSTQGCTEALNCVPSPVGYRALRRPAAYSTPLTGAVRGAFWLNTSDGTYVNFAGTATGLWRFSAGTWLNVSKPGGYAAGSPWSFVKYGPRVIACARGVPVQFLDVENPAQTTFLDLPGGPPQAVHVAVVRDQIVLGNTSSASAPAGGAFVQWSGINNSEAWGTSTRNSSDYNELLGRGGAVQRIVPGEQGIIFQEHSVWRMDFAEPPLNFRFTEIQPSVGTPAPYSVTWLGSQVFFLGWDGFYMLNAAGALAPIGKGKIDNWFRANCGDLYSVQAAVDRRNAVVFFLFKTSASLTEFDAVLIFDIVSGTWSHASTRLSWIEELSSAGYRLDELDVPLPGGIDTGLLMVDSDAYAGGGLQFTAFVGNAAVTFSGEPFEAILESREIHDLGRRTFVSGVRPHVRLGPLSSVGVQILRRAVISERLFETPEVPVDRNGVSKFRVDDRYFRARVRVRGMFSHAEGVEAEIAPRKGRQ